MPTARAKKMSTLKMPPGCELVPTSLLPPPVKVGAKCGEPTQQTCGLHSLGCAGDVDMTQVDNELTGKGDVDVWEVDRIVGARRLGDGTCLYGVV